MSRRSEFLGSSTLQRPSHEDNAWKRHPAGGFRAGYFTGKHLLLPFLRIRARDEDSKSEVRVQWLATTRRLILSPPWPRYIHDPVANIFHNGQAV
jgi:hypothetical protein